MGVKRPRVSHDKAIVDVWQREVGLLSSRNFAHRLAASQLIKDIASDGTDLVLRLEILRKLEKHRGCVNTVSFNGSGDILVSGSDDRRVILWDWEFGRVKLSFHSGHSNNVFQAKFMPYSDDRSIVTCAADGQVRHAQITDGGHVETLLLGSHQGRAHKLAIEPGSPHIFYTCGEDGLVQHKRFQDRMQIGQSSLAVMVAKFDLRTKASTELFTCHSTPERRSHINVPVVQLNAIAIDPRNPNLFAVGGSDEYARLYDIRRYKWDGSTDFGQPINYYSPDHLVANKIVGITGIAFSDQSELLVSYNNEHIYLFMKDMGWGPNPAPSTPVSTCSDADEPECNDSLETSKSVMETDKKNDPLVFKGHQNCDTVKGVGFFGPKCEYVVSGSDCGRIFIWRKRDGELIRVMEADKHVVNCIESHPHATVLASSGIENDIKIWTPKSEKRVTLPANLNEDFLELILSFSRHNGSSSDNGGDDIGPEDYYN
ncbi:hypothetical protein Cgig2_014719 [Carnegiea gigantea]|uniref:DDB1- and CUL4-associated factor 8 n=1 Tax=Carnegiea gigantea TaxID=171969 RepID=A0A9Q1QTH0_9CARY|nr:hypothetical protein Cgig2_014719 [Carnegiea gigantea]